VSKNFYHTTLSHYGDQPQLTQQTPPPTGPWTLQQRFPYSTHTHTHTHTP